MRNDRRERIGNDLSEYQKWVDYDMKKYGRISDITKSKIRKVGLSIVKDQYGDYEVIADRPIKEKLKESESVGDKMFKLNGINLKDWYTKEFPDDELGYELNDDVDLRRCYSSLGRDPDIYDVMGVGDSVIRERVFAKMADVLGVDYDVIYYKWLGVNEGLKEDTVKQGNYWVNKGKEGTHGKFRTKKAADAQRKAMFAQGFKEGLNEDFKEMVDWGEVDLRLGDALGDKLMQYVEVYFDDPRPLMSGDTIIDFEILWGGDDDGFATTDIKGTMFGSPAQITMKMHFPKQRYTEEVSVHNIDEMANALIKFGRGQSSPIKEACGKKRRVR